MRKYLICALVLGLGVVGCKTIPPSVTTKQAENGLQYTFVSSGTDCPGQVLKGIIVSDAQGNVVDSSYASSTRTRDAIAVGAVGGVPTVLSAGIGAYGFYRGMGNFNPPADTTNVQQGNSNASTGNIGAAKAFAGSSSKAVTSQKQFQGQEQGQGQIQKQIMIDD